MPKAMPKFPGRTERGSVEGYHFAQSSEMSGLRGEAS
jgi:hypothetical protein